MTEAQKKKFAEILGIPEETRQVLDAGSSHPYTCKCEVCRQWWRSVGPEDGDTYGPFTKEEIDKP